MADIYVRSTDGDNADSGATWALAKATVTGASAIDAAGDNIYVSQAYSETATGTMDIALAGTNSSPVKVICANDAAQPPTASATGALIKTTGLNTLRVSGSAYVYGITFECGTGASNAVMSLNSAVGGFRQVYENCTISSLSTASGSNIQIGASSASNADPNRTILIDCDIKLSSAAGIFVFGEAEWSGGSILSGTTGVTTLFKPPTIRPALFYGDSIDLTNLPAACSLFSATSHGRWVIANSKLPESWTGGLISGTPVGAFRASMYNCDNADTNYRLWIEDFAGSIKSETTIVRTSGATDGTTPISWKMTTSASANEYVAPLISDPISVWSEVNDGSSKTVTVQIIHDSTTDLTDAEVWLEVTFMGTSTRPLGVVLTDHRADILATAAAQDTTGATWTTTGLTNPNTQTLSVSITPQEKGFITARVFVGKPSYTIYVDPEITVT